MGHLCGRFRCSNARVRESTLALLRSGSSFICRPKINPFHGMGHLYGRFRCSNARVRESMLTLLRSGVRICLVRSGENKCV